MTSPDDQKVSSVWARDAGEDLTAELLSGGLIDEIAEAVAKHNVGISLTVFPHTESEEDD